jgi:UDP-2,3-diacylglucosamine hydrolase
VADYFASDVHLRLDRPERGRRLARLVGALDPGDSLTIVGDLCDFWFAARHREGEWASCEGLRALASFRGRGGDLSILVGNHDAWLGPFYERALGARMLREPLEVESHGLRLLLVHGHLLGARPPWKAWMEGRAFLEAFRRVPGPLARGLDRLLERSNDRGFEADARRHLAVFRRYVAGLAGTPVDVVVLGHLHRVVDEAGPSPRLVVLGDWTHQSSYLRVDASGASLIVEPDAARSPAEVKPSGPVRHAEIRPSPAHRPPLPG